MEHTLGPTHAPVLFEQFGDYECLQTGQVRPLIEKLRAYFPGQIRFVFKHFPQKAHTHAERAAEAAEAAAQQGKFWEMQEILLANPGRLSLPELIDYAERLKLDMERFEEELTNHAHLRQVAQDLREGVRYGVRKTPEFFINGVLYEGPLEMGPLCDAIQKTLDREIIRRAI